MINTTKIDAIVEKFIVDRDWGQFHSVKNLAIALNVEASELLEIFQWLSEEDSNALSQNPDLKEKAGEEIADIFIYLSRIAKKLDVDIERAVLDKITKNELKYPIEKAKGNAKKYTSY